MPDTETNQAVAIESQPASEPAPPSSGAVAEESPSTIHADDTALDQILGADDAPSPENAGTEAADAASTDGRARDEQGRFVSKENQPAEESAPETPKDTPEPAVPEGVNPEEYRKALAALYRDTVPQDAIDAKTPDQVIEWGRRVAKRQADNDGYAQRIAELERAQETPGQSAEADAQSAQPDIDWSKAVEPFAQAFKENFGDDVDIADPLTAFGKQIYDTMSKQLEPLRQQNEVFRMHVIHKEMQSARSGLRDRFPQLDDPQKFEKVMLTMEALNQTGSYQEANDLMAAACRTEFSEDIIAEYERNRHGQHKARANGQPTTQHRAEAPKQSKTPAGAEDDFLHAILTGDDETVRRSIGPTVGAAGQGSYSQNLM